MRRDAVRVYAAAAIAPCDRFFLRNEITQQVQLKSFYSLREISSREQFKIAQQILALQQLRHGGPAAAAAAAAAAVQELRAAAARSRICHVQWGEEGNEK
jgi:hypothetical protein